MHLYTPFDLAWHWNSPPSTMRFWTLLKTLAAWQTRCLVKQSLNWTHWMKSHTKRAHWSCSCLGTISVDIRKPGRWRRCWGGRELMSLVLCDLLSVTLYPPHTSPHAIKKKRESYIKNRKMEKKAGPSPRIVLEALLYTFPFSLFRTSAEVQGHVGAFDKKWAQAGEGEGGWSPIRRWPGTQMAAGPALSLTSGTAALADLK